MERSKWQSPQRRVSTALLLLAGLSAAIASILAAAPPPKTAHARQATAAATIGANAQLPSACTELLINGDFEAAALGWTQTSAGGYELISQFNPRTGAWGAYLAGEHYADDRLSQTVTLSASAGSSVTLKFWWSLESEEPAGAFDTLEVALLRPNGTLLTTLLTMDNTASSAMWEEVVLDLTPYSEQTVTLRFAAATNGANLTDFYVDDVSLMACAAAATSTATASPTPTATTIRSPTPTTTSTPTPPERGVFLPLLVKG